MTHLTYTIAHINVAEKYYEEIEGCVSNSLKLLQIDSLTYDDTGELYSIGNNCMGDLVNIILEGTIFKYINQNPNHPLSELASKLGAIVYGGFEDEKDFYLLLPTVGGLKVGDYAITHRTDQNYNPIKGTKISYVVGFGSLHCREIKTVGFYALQASTTTKILQIATTPEIFEQKINTFNDQKVLSPTHKGNIFQEYARTGIIENELYKQFFK